MLFFCNFRVNEESSYVVFLLKKFLIFLGSVFNINGELCFLEVNEKLIL